MKFLKTVTAHLKNENFLVFSIAWHSVMSSLWADGSVVFKRSFLFLAVGLNPLPLLIVLDFSNNTSFLLENTILEGAGSQSLLSTPIIDFGLFTACIWQPARQAWFPIISRFDGSVSPWTICPWTKIRVQYERSGLLKRDPIEAIL